MTVRVKYFGSLRERIGRAEDILTLDSDATVADIWARVSNRHYWKLKALNRLQSGLLA
jgi:molybdopterin synthase sulfur carrier subunit